MQKSKFAPLGNLLKSSREASGFTQAQIAKKFGYTTPQFVSNWERGLAAPPMKELKKLGEMYKIKPDDLFDVLVESVVENTKFELTRAFGRR